MILRLEVDHVRDVSHRGPLSLLRIAQADTCSTNRFILLNQAVTVECPDFEVFQQKVMTVVLLPLPVFDWSQSRSNAVFVCGNQIRLQRGRSRGVLIGWLEWQGRRLNFSVRALFFRV